MNAVQITNGVVTITGLTCDDTEVVNFLTETSEVARDDVTRRAIAIGVTGMRAIGVAGHVDIVEREFERLARRFDEALAGTETHLLNRVADTFDPESAESVSARLTASVGSAHNAATQVVTQARSDLEKLITDSFNPDLATSCVYRLGKLVNDTRSELDRLFDPAYEGSHLSTLTKLIQSYFGDDGSLGGLVAAQVLPAKAELLEALQGLRDLVAGQAMAAEERRRSPASGLDFEDEVEAVLCRIAAAYGDAVQRVGTQPGDTGKSKHGDFVVEIPCGLRFVVEAKKRSTPLPLRGDRGILALLNDSMTNRQAGFAIAVGTENRVFAREVGAFNEYDGNKILCRLGDGGDLLEAAYRWARASLLAASAAQSGVDIAVVTDGIDEARKALRELSRIEAKAKSIAHTADEIKSLVSFQVRRVHSALDKASDGLLQEAERAAS